MFKGVSTDKKLLLISVTITVLGTLLPWVDVHETPLRGIHFKYGIRILILLIVILLVVHFSRKMLVSILIVIFSFLSLFTVFQSFVDIFGSSQTPSFFNLGIGVFVTGLGTIGMIISGISGIINHKRT